MTRSRYLTALFGCVVSSFGWFCATNMPVVKVGTALLVAMWAARLIVVYRESCSEVK